MPGVSPPIFEKTLCRIDKTVLDSLAGLFFRLLASGANSVKLLFIFFPLYVKLGLYAGQPLRRRAGGPHILTTEPFGRAAKANKSLSQEVCRERRE